MTDNTNVNYVQYKGDYYLSTETNFMNKVDIETLEKKEKVKNRFKMNKVDSKISCHSKSSESKEKIGALNKNKVTHWFRSLCTLHPD